MLGIRKYIFMLARKFGKCIRSTLNSCLGRNLERKKTLKVTKTISNGEMASFWNISFWNILPDNQNLGGDDHVKKKNKTLGTGTK